MNLNIISFNIRYCDDKEGNTIFERAPRLKEVTLPKYADIICFQEYTPLWEKHIERIYGEKYAIFNRYRSVSSLEGVPILWKRDKFELLKSGYFWLSDTPEIESRGWDELYHCYRICLYVILKEKKSGKEFTVINTHFGFGDKGQSDSARLIFEYSQKISGNPTFITGDFNMHPEDLGYCEMVKHFDDANMLTKKDLSTTYHGYCPEKITDEHIDYCFIDKNIKAVDVSLIDEKVDGAFPSDHYGLFIELDI